jgi:hypothetical protein
MDGWMDGGWMVRGLIGWKEKEEKTVMKRKRKELTEADTSRASGLALGGPPWWRARVSFASSAGAHTE